MLIYDSVYWDAVRCVGAKVIKVHNGGVGMDVGA